MRESGFFHIPRFSATPAFSSLKILNGVARWGCVCREVITLCNIREPGEGIPQIDEDLAVCSGQTMSPSFSRIAASKFVGNDKA